jgi:hypothetical protein
MPDASGRPRRKRLSWECRCEIVAKVRLQGMRPELAATAPLADVLTPWPGLADPDHVLRTVETFHHPVGSCRMIRPDNPVR